MIKVVNLPTPLWGADTSGKITPPQALKYAAGFYKGNPLRFIIRTIGIGSNSAADLDAAELRYLLQAGLAVGCYQHVRGVAANKYLWTPTAEMGAQDGTNAARNACVIGYPGGAMIGVDLEGMTGGDPLGYTTAKCAAIVGGGYTPVIYNGYASGLTQKQWPQFQSSPIWKDMAPLSDRPIPKSMTYSMEQLDNTVICDGGFYVDHDMLSGPIPFAIDDSFATWVPQTNVETADPAAGQTPEPAA